MSEKGSDPLVDAKKRLDIGLVGKGQTPFPTKPNHVTTAEKPIETASPGSMERPPKLFAVIPAAGHSRRMGRPKLLLPLGSKTVIARLLDVIQRREVTETFVVVRQDDEELQREVESAGATVIQPPIDPPDMRDSVEFALQEIGRKHVPAPTDGWLLVPADHPLLDTSVMDSLIARWNQDNCEILVPCFQQKRGHPTFFRWMYADAVFQIPRDRGLNWLTRSNASKVVEFEVETPTVTIDLDSPDDYEQLQARWRNE